jgi:hypothetical protein
MAKKAVATYRDKSKQVALVKLIQSFKNPDTGGVSFKEIMIPQDGVVDYLKSTKEGK